MFARKVVYGKKKQQLVNDGKAIVAVTSETSIKFVYEYKTGQLSVSFTIQRYNADGVAVDSTVQAQANSAESTSSVDNDA